MNGIGIANNASSGLSIFNTDFLEKCDYLPLEDFIEKVDIRNSNNAYDVSYLRGVTSDGVFDKSKAKTDGIDFSKYKIVEPGVFAYNPSRINLGSIALCESTYIISPMYVVFKIKDDKSKELLAEYLNIWFTRSEFRRSTLFYASGSVRDTFSLEEMKRVKIPIPPIDVQKAIVSIFKIILTFKDIASRAESALKPLCPSLMLHCIKD